MKVKESKINGLRTYFADYPGAKSASVQIWFRAGSSLETGKDKGIAHFLEHMFFKGTPKRPGHQIAHEVESFGGEINAFTSFDYTCYYINTPKKYMNNAVEILLDMVSNPMFLESELIPEKGVVFEEFRRSLDNPNHYGFQKIQQDAFSPGYSHPILGTESSIKGFQQKQLIEFRKKFYNLSNAALLISSDFSDIQKTKSIIKKFKLPKGPKAKFKNFKISTKSNTIHIHNKDVTQASLTLTIQAPQYESFQAAAEDLAINCLCHGESSYLTKRLVKETSLATYTSGSTMFMNSGGAHFIKIVYPPQNHKLVLENLSKVLGEIAKNEFSIKDVQKIKNQYVASKIYEKESLEAFAFTLGHGFAQNEDIESEEKFIESIKASSPKEVNTAFKSIFIKNKIHFHLQLPLKEKSEKFAKDLHSLAKNIKNIYTKKDSSVRVKKSSKFDKSVKLINVKPGIQLLYKQNKNVPTSVLHAYIKGGLATENTKNNGAHYLLSKALTYGHCEERYENFKFRLDNLSASLRGFSGKNAYGLTMHCLSENFNELKNDFFNTLINPSFPKNYVNLEKEIIERSLEHFKVDPLKQCFRKFQTTTFKDHPYSMDIIGSEKSLKNLSEKTIQDTHQKNLNQREMLFTYCGDFPLEKIKTYIDEALISVNKRDKKDFKEKIFKISQNQSFHIPFEREQTQVFIGFPGLHLNNKNDIFLKVLTNYLSGQSSELFVEVRDRRGLCYSTQPIHHSALQGGYWGIYIGAGADKAKEAIKAIMAIIEKIKRKGFTQKELNRVKKMILGSKSLQLQSNEDFANYYSIPVLHGLSLDFEDEQMTRIQKMKAEDFNHFIKKFLSQKRITVTAGPYKP